jgi:N-methylhydantoinase A/oxoprolinase/acetone carboxylase beta subunit
VPGVANVAIWGQRDRQFQVLVDPDRLRAASVTLDQVTRAAGDATVLESGGFVDTPIYQRSTLAKDTRISGPAIVEQSDTTVLVPPGTSLRVDQYLNILIDIGRADRPSDQAAAAEPAAHGA